VIANVIVTMVGGQETTTNLIGNGVLSLLRNPDQLEKLRSDLSLIPSAVEELLRYESPSQHTARLASEDLELGGKQIRKRQAVIAVMAAGNRDPERFPDPDRLDITRRDNHHLAFGWAAHFCFGAPLARTEGQIAFETMLQRLPKLALEPGPVVWRTNLGLRGLTALPISFAAHQLVARSHPERKQRSLASGVNRPEPMSETSTLSDTKRLLLERYLRGELAQSRRDLDAITPRPSGKPAPLSLTQEQVWLRAQATTGMPPLYNESITIHYVGSLDVAALERSVTEIVRRHEIWRTTFDSVGGQPVQIIQPASTITLPVMDLRTLPESEREAEALRLATSEARRPFDLKHGPLVRATLLRMSDSYYRLYMIVHQIILDGVSVYHVLLPELARLYEAFSAGEPSPLPELPIQYADYAYWQRHWLRGEELAKQVTYWQKQLAGDLPVLEWPAGRPRPAAQTFRGAIQPFALSRHLTEALRDLSQREGATLFVTLLAGFIALLHRYTKQSEIVVGTAAPAGRKRTEVQGLLGYFLNPVALRIDLSNNPTILELIQQAREVASGALSHDDVPLEYLAHEMKLRRDPSRHPFFTVAISLEPPMPALDSRWNLTPMDVESGGGRWDLYIVLDDRRDGMIGRVQYNPDVFNAKTIISTLDDFQFLLEHIAANPQQHLSDLPAWIIQRSVNTPAPANASVGTNRQ
jgi:hypothetical protein